MASKEKILRLCLAIWKNCLVKCHDLVIPVMIGCKLTEQLESIKARGAADEETKSDLEYLEQELEGAYSSLNSFDEYASEIKSGQLQWSPPHKSELFWSDNARRLNENNFELLSLLGRLISLEEGSGIVHAAGSLEKIIAIALNDIGQYVAHCPLGAENLQKLSIKQKIMMLISHEDPEVRFQALTTMQKYMTKLWSPAS